MVHQIDEGMEPPEIADLVFAPEGDSDDEDVKKEQKQRSG